eukprot:GDKK01048320.1.p1 GENE.GDKK01048320.1~~GDKK01048320.1.p1  ORF type:complete len:202 (+),score=42.51 GDKK01048320.1:149-754(+)
MLLEFSELGSVSSLLQKECKSRLAFIKHPSFSSISSISSLKNHEILPEVCSSDLERSRHWIVDLLMGLKVLHDRGVVHRDIKIDNLLLFKRENQDEVPLLKIADFGLCTLPHHERLLTLLTENTSTSESSPRSNGKENSQNSKFGSGIEFGLKNFLKNLNEDLLLLLLMRSYGHQFRSYSPSLPYFFFVLNVFLVINLSSS